MPTVTYPDVYASEVLLSLNIDFTLKNDVIYTSVSDVNALDITIFSGSLPTQQEFSDQGDTVKLLKLIDEYSQAMWDEFDKEAQTKDYDNALTCLSYTNSTNVTWQPEAQAFSNWRDACWVYAYAKFDDWKNAVTSPDTLSTFISGLPSLVW